MTKQLNENKINELAVMYATTHSHEILIELLEELQPMIRNEARKASAKYQIEYDDLIAEFTRDVWEAVKGEAVKSFDGSSNITQRIHTFFKCSVTEFIKYRTASRRSGMVVVSSDAYQHHSSELIDSAMLYGGQPNLLEDNVVAEEWIDETLAGFRKSNERYCKVIELIYLGFTNQEIALALGSPSYDEAIRQIVSRAKKLFKKHLESNPHAA